MHNRGANRTARRGLDGIRARAWAKFGFTAPRKSSVLLTRGAGAYSFTRATTATVEDWEGAIRVCKSGEVRFPGARRVENGIASASENLTSVTWVAVSGFTKVNATQLDTAAGANILRNNTAFLTANSAFRVSFDAYIVSGVASGTLTVDVGNAYATAVTIDAVLKRYSVLITPAALTNQWLDFEWTGGGVRIYLSRVQIENVTGQSNQNPAEYVSVGVLSSPFHGAMVDGVKYFEHQNGNTVASNVVTEAMGATLTTCKGQLDETVSTNLVLQSSNFGASWVPSGTPTRTAAAKYCGSIALDLIGDDDAAANESYAINLTFTGNGQKAVSWLVAQDTAVSSCVIVRDTTAPANRFVGVVTWSNGAPVLTCTVGSQERPPKQLVTGVWRVFGLTASVTAANGHNIQVHPAGDAALTASNTGRTYIGGVQAENATTASSHIPTTTGPVTRNADAGSYPSAGNVSASGGTLYLEYEIERDTGADQVLAEIGDSSSNERITFYRGAAGGLTVYVADGGAAQCVLNLGAAAVGSSGKIAVRWAANDFAGVMTGGAIQTDASGTLPTVTAIFPGNGRGTAYQAQGPTKNLRISQQLLSNAELLALVK